MFITVYFGENQELVCNPECNIRNLLDNIKERCSSCCQTTDTIDLTDTRGNLQNLAFLDSQYDVAHASHHLSDINRGEYVLLKIEQDESGRVQHIPLPEKACLTYPILLDNLDIPNWVEGAGQRSSSRKLNRLRLATKLVMVAAHDKKQKPPSASKKSINRSTSSGEPSSKKERSSSSGEKSKKNRK
ncbi:hypothetical protein ACHWQZ_G013910 [Mnemiopsis leidyi]